MPALLGATTIVISKIGMPVSGLCHLTSHGRRIKFPLLRRYNFPAVRGVRHHHMQKTMGSGLPIPTYSLGNGRPDPRTLAFGDESVWQEEAIVALEEYWAPGALYR